MDRKAFLSLLGLGAGAAVAGCLGGCTKNVGSGSTNGPTGVDFTLDLTQSSNAALQTNGGYVYRNGIIVARTLNGDFIAVQQVCTHQNFSVVYEANNHLFYCGGHGGTFAENGQVMGGPPPRPLATYKTSLSGNSLRVYS